LLLDTHTHTHTRERERAAAAGSCSGIVMGLVSEAEARRPTTHTLTLSTAPPALTHSLRQTDRATHSPPHTHTPRITAAHRCCCCCWPAVRVLAPATTTTSNARLLRHSLPCASHSLTHSLTHSCCCLCSSFVLGVLGCRGGGEMM
jgi:hypothetical protein